MTALPCAFVEGWLVRWGMLPRGSCVYAPGKRTGPAGAAPAGLSLRRYASADARSAAIAHSCAGTVEGILPQPFSVPTSCQ